MPADPDPIGTDLSRARRTRKLPPNAACVICGHTEPDALKRARRSLLEQHHLAGKVNDDQLTVVLCLNHHREQTARQRGMGVELEEAPATDVERLVSMLRGLALFLEALAGSCVEWAERLAAHIARLDANSPAWRNNEPNEP
jgi:hypothetical protein